MPARPSGRPAFYRLLTAIGVALALVTIAWAQAPTLKPGSTVKQTDRTRAVLWIRKTQFLTGTDDGALHAWAIGQLGSELDPKLAGHDSAVTSLALRPTASSRAPQFLSGGLDGVARLWVVPGNPVASPTLTISGGLALGPPDGRIALGSGKSIQVWAPATDTDGSKAVTLTGHAANVTAVVWNGNNSIVSADADGTVNVWNGPFSSSTQPAGTIAILPKTAVRALGLAKVNSVIAGSDDGLLRVAGVPAGNGLTPAKAATTPVLFVSSADGKNYAAVQGQFVAVYQAPDGTLKGKSDDLGQAVLAVAIGPDGSTAAYALADNTVGRLKLDTAKSALGKDGTPAKAAAKVSAVALASDWLAYATVDGSGTAGVTIQKANGTAAPALGPPTGQVRALIFGQSDSTKARLLGALANNPVLQWQATGTGTIAPSTLATPGAAATALDLSDDGNTLALATAEAKATVQLWDVTPGATTPKRLAAADGHPATKPLKAVALSRDGRRVVSGAADGSVILWDSRPVAGTLRALQSVSGPAADVIGFQVGADASSAVAAWSGQSVQVWQPAVKQTLEPKADGSVTPPVNALATNGDGSLAVVVANDGNARVFDLAKSQVSTVDGLPKNAKAAQFLTANTVAVGLDDGSVSTWTAPGPSAVLIPAPASGGGIVSLAVSSDGTGPVGLVVGTDSGACRQYGLTGPPSRAATVLRQSFSTGGAAVSAVANFPAAGAPNLSDNDSLVTVTGTQVGLWPAAGERGALPLRVLDRDHERVNCVAWAPDGSSAALAAADGSIRFWDADAKTQSAKVKAHPNTAFAVVYIDTNTVATGGDDQVVKLWPTTAATTQTGQAVGHSGAVRCLAFQPSSSTLASGSVDKTVRVWDVSNPAAPKVKASLTGPSGAVRALAFQPGGTLLAAGDSAGSVVVWDASTLAAAPAGTTLKVGAGVTVLGVAWSTSGNQLAAGASDGNVYLFTTP
jgi:WD40 repeat protein